MAATGREQMAFRPRPGTIARVDGVRGELSRNEWVCRAVEAALESGDVFAGSSPAPASSPRLDAVLVHRAAMVRAALS